LQLNKETAMANLNNKVAIITGGIGGIGGIGRGIVAHFLDLGAQVAVVDIVEQEKGDAAGDERPARGASLPGGLCGQRRGDDGLVGDSDGHRA